MTLRLLCAALLVAGLPCAAGPAQNLDSDILRRFTALTPDQWRDVDQGNIVARMIDTTNRLDVAVIGVARLRADTACFLTQFRDIERFKKSPDVLRIGKFAKPVEPGEPDLKGFALEPEDVSDLENCHIGDCKVKVLPQTLGRLIQDVKWSTPDHATRVQEIWRDDLAEYVDKYVSEGNSALIRYHDKEEPVSLDGAFLQLLDARPAVAEISPALYNYLASYPAEAGSGNPPGIDEFFYWSVERFGLKPVASITHVVIDSHPGQAVIASQQIYASHYFDASLGLTVALDTPKDDPHPGMYLVYLNRSRIDLFSGPFGGLRRYFAGGRVTDGLKKNMANVVQRIEKSCPAGDGQQP
jgi:hypothetical protein